MSDEIKEAHGETKKEDLISILPQDIHLRLFTYLKYDDATNLSLANRILYASSLHRDYKTIKKGTIQQLIISQNKLGHMIEAKIPGSGNFYQIFTSDSEDPLFVSEKSDPKYFKAHLKENQHMLRDRYFNQFHKVAPHVNLLNRIPQLLKQYNLRMLKFQAIVFDAAFLAKCKEVFRGIDVTEVSFNQAEFQNEVGTEYEHSFTEFISSMKPTTVYFGQSRIEESNLLNRHFFTSTAAASSKNKSKLKVVVSNRSMCYPNGFFPSVKHSNERRWNTPETAAERALAMERSVRVEEKRDALMQNWIQTIVKDVSSTHHPCRFEIDLTTWKGDIELGAEFKLQRPLLSRRDYTNSVHNEGQLITVKGTDDVVWFILHIDALICESVPKEGN